MQKFNNSCVVMAAFPSIPLARFVAIIADVISAPVARWLCCASQSIAFCCLLLHQCRVYLRRDDKMHDFMTLEFAVNNFLLLSNMIKTRWIESCLLSTRFSNYINQMMLRRLYFILYKLEVYSKFFDLESVSMSHTASRCSFNLE